MTTSTVRPSALLKRLEAESIFILRETVSECSNPVMLYSTGKDSSVLLHLAIKAFHPAKPPFPLLHVDTAWAFKDMISFREAAMRRLGLDLLVHVNEEGLKRGIDPFDSGSDLHLQVMKTEALQQALGEYRFDAAFCGARRDEGGSRAKQRIFSFHNGQHVCDPKDQRPEFWRLYNTRLRKGELIRVSPLSNWTELDVWQYILAESIPIVPLYFASLRPVVKRDGTLILADDERLKLRGGETIETKMVRFRTLGCYPLTGAIESRAATIEDIVGEMLAASASEPEDRVIDPDQGASLGKKKLEGYF